MWCRRVVYPCEGSHWSAFGVLICQFGIPELIRVDKVDLGIMGRREEHPGGVCSCSCACGGN